MRAGSSGDQNMRRLIFGGLAFAAIAVATFALTVRLTWSGNRRPTPINVEQLRPPDRLVTDMTRFVNQVDNAVDYWGRGMPGSAPVHGSGLWGYYLALIDKEPWHTEAVAQQARDPRRSGWPPLPLEGPLLEDPAFTGRVLELYVGVEALPNVEWSRDQLRSLQLSARTIRDVVVTACAYGDDCLLFSRRLPVDAQVPQETQMQRLWRWRVGRTVISISALGAPGWPVEAMTPLLEYYAAHLPTVRAVQENRRVEPTPRPLSLPR